MRSDSPAPLVSVIIPAYNAAKFIDETLRSARSQDYQSLELIIINDGSTDNTADILANHAQIDSRIHIVNTENQGVAKARNTGISIAKGDYIAFLDADDLWHNSKISEQIDVITADIDAQYCASYALYRVIDETGNIIHSTSNVGPSGYILAQHFVRHFIGNGSSLLVKRDTALAVGGFDPWYAEHGLGGCEDLDFELKVAAQGRLACVQRYLVAYRRYEGNMSSNRLRMARSMVTTIRRRLSDHPGLPNYARRHALGSAYLFAFTMFRQAGSLAGAAGAFVKLGAYDPTEMLRLSRRFLRKAFNRTPPRPADFQSAETHPPARFAELKPNDPHILAPRHNRAELDARLSLIDAELYAKKLGHFAIS